MDTFDVEGLKQCFEIFFFIDEEPHLLRICGWALGQIIGCIGWLLVLHFFVFVQLNDFHILLVFILLARISRSDRGYFR